MAPVPVSKAAGWLAWLRPAFAVPVFALLLAVVGYQNFVTVPRLELRDGGILADVAPTVLELLGIEQPAEMTGHTLVADR